MIPQLKALGAKALNAMVHGVGGWFSGGWSFRKKHDYAKEVGRGLDASVVMAPIQWLQRTLPTAPIAVQRLKGEGQALPDHPLVALLRRPNTGYSGEHLLAATLFSLCWDGNGYWIKIRDGNDKVVELWYAPHWLMKPKWSQDGKDFISHYDYTPGGVPMKLEVSDVVHFRIGMNPENPRLGLAPLRAVIREIWSDMEVPGFVAALLRNGGVPGLIISPDGPIAAKPNDVQDLKRFMRENFTGDKRGDTMVMSAKTKVDRLGFNPQELDLSSVSDRAEERVCALLGIPTVVVGFGAGNSQTSVGATMHEQVRLAWHNAVIPMQSVLAAEIERSLLPDFEKKNPEQFDVYFDTTEVEALDDETDKVVARAERLVRAGMIKIGEGRQMIGLESDETHNIYLRPFGVIEIPGDTNRAPESELDAGGFGAPPAAGAPKSRRRGAKHSHSLLEERIAQSAPHAEPTAELENFIASCDAISRKMAKRFEKQLVGFFKELGAAAGEAARPILEDALKGAPVGNQKNRRRFGKAFMQAKANESLNLMVTDRVIEAMNLPERTRLFKEYYERHFLDVAKAIAKSSGAIGLGTDLPDRVGRAVIATGGRRAGLVDLEGQARDSILRSVAEQRAQGAGAQDIARAIEDDVPAGPWSDSRVRSLIIARSETKYAQNVSVLEHARANDVQQFMVFDARLGDSDEICEQLDGAIVSADEAAQLVSDEHPNGTRSISPYFG